MITVEEALQLVKSHSKTIAKTKRVTLANALGCIVAQDVYSPINMPPFRQSAMDGYALHFHDKNTYTVVDEVKAGDGHHPTIKAGEAIRIFTGSAVPDSAQTVIMQEKTSREGAILTLTHAVTTNENIRPLGEQVQKGDLALAKGTLLNPAGIGYLTTLGIVEVEVYVQPKITIITTGSELVAAGEELPYGKIYESNSVMLLTALQQLGYTNVSTTKVKDDYTSTLSKLKEAIASNDLVLLSGGISVGDYDFVGKALLELGTNQIFYKVKQKPGKPLFFGIQNNTPIFALPGNPASALSSFYVYVQTALKIMSGNDNDSLLRLTAQLNTAYIKKGDRAQFLKAYVQNDQVSILEGQSSAMLHTFAKANAFVYVPHFVQELKEGERVQILPLAYN